MNTNTRYVGTITLAIGLLCSGVALAQGQVGNEAAAKEAASDAWVPVRHLEFTPDDVEGGVLGPDGEAILVTPKATHSSLIEIRQGFEPEIMKTLENL
jgi:hypothetical protein